MTRKLLLCAAAIVALIAALSTDYAYAQSSSGRSQGCFDASGAHHRPGWCAKHGK